MLVAAPLRRTVGRVVAERDGPRRSSDHCGTHAGRENGQGEVRRHADLLGRWSAGVEQTSNCEGNEHHAFSNQDSILSRAEATDNLETTSRTAAKPATTPNTRTRRWRADVLLVDIGFDMKET